MPFTNTESKILKDMQKRHGKEAGEREFYASVNEGILGPESKKRHGSKARARRNKRAKD